MKFKNSAAVLSFGLVAFTVYAQTPPSPPTAPTPPASPASAAAADAPAVTPAVPPAPPAPPKPTSVDGTLMRSQRANDDRGKFTWVCTYNVAGTKRNVQLDESCPSTLPFELRR